MSAYVKTNWVNGQQPAINAENLNHIEEGIYQNSVGKIDAMVEITWSALKALRDGGNLVPGQQYCITDYQCTTTTANTSSAGHQFDIIVTADSASVLNENARAALHASDTYFVNSNLAAWQLKYCLDNNTNRFAWADAANGKGVIYWMKDEFNNECAYDFKNILCHYEDYDRYIYTFGIFVYDGDDTNVIDLSLNTILNGGNYECGCTGNIIKAYFDHSDDSQLTGYGKRQYLNNIRFINEKNVDGSVNTMCCYDNFFDFGCHDIEIGKCCSLNHFGCDCRNISVGIASNYNVIGDDCSDSDIVGNGNVIGSNCRNLWVSGNRNRIGARCENVTIAIESHDNVVGSNCTQVTIGSNSICNTVGNNVNDVTFGTSTYPGGHYQCVTVDSGCSYIDIKTSANSYNEYLFHAHIHEGIHGQYHLQKSIVLTPSSSAPIDVYPANTIEVILD